MIRDIAFIAYAVRDIPKAVAFYRDVLGLKPGEPSTVRRHRASSRERAAA